MNMPIIAGATRVVAVIGDPIVHSLSPAMHNAAFAALGLDFVMVPLRIAPADLAIAIAGLAAVGIVGASITMPHKQAIVSACTHIKPAALAAGAVNCVHFGDQSSTITGDNTDGIGFVTALAHARVDAARVVLLGAGGAARAVAAALRDAGSHVTVLARRPHEIAWSPLAQPDVVAGFDATSMRAAFASATLVVDATPTGLHTSDELDFVEQLPLEALAPNATVASLAYHRQPELLRRAAARGLATLDGSAMLVHQGARAFTWWTGYDAPVGVMTAALTRALRPA